ncbi:hypothetical protein CHUAL_003919 [Chamberlinius hualienensis]
MCISTSNAGHNILMLTSPLGSRSHSIFFNGIAQELASRGHYVSHRCIGQLENVGGIRNYANPSYVSDEILFFFFFKAHEQSLYNVMRIMFIEMTETILSAINRTYSEPLLKDLITQPINSSTGKPKYDIIIADTEIGLIYLPLANHLKVPFVYVTPQISLSHEFWNFGLPYHYFLNLIGNPNLFFGIITRATNLIFQTCLSFYFNYYIVEKVQNATSLFFPNSPPLRQLMANVSFMLTRNPLSNSDALPSSPNVINLECVYCRAPQPLPEILERLMENSGEHGVIYFSFGSIVKHEWIPKEFLNKVISALQSFPQTIIWKGQLKEKNLTNFYSDEWYPQQDLLAHSKVRLIITHGGLGAVQEAMYHGCPILGFPLGFEQHYNMKVVVENNMGISIDWNSATIDEIRQAISKMLKTNMYKEAAMIASGRMKDFVDKPTTRAAYWTEYIIRHKGAPFLKNMSEHFSWWQYFMLDVMSIAVVIMSMAFFIIIQIINLSTKWRRRCGLS